ncbi:MAG TPA: hypothetical protein VGV38_23230 [Pyrinomonadaceae bacterium]|nr:hypothetical protein [Pyrinomonadaceae bacterium]
MRREASHDFLTVTAIGVIAYAGVNVCHELIGHCGMVALMGTRCTQFSSTDIRLADTLPLWKYHVVVVAGSAANWALAFVCLALLRACAKARPALRYLLFLSACVNLFLPGTYMLAAPVIRYGDSYILISTLPNQLLWRSVVVSAAAVICWLSFRLCRAEFVRLVGRSTRADAWALVAPAYVAGGVVTVASALFSELPARWAQLQAAGGTFGLTVWLLLLPLGLPRAPTHAGETFTVPRSAGLIAAGALTALVFVGLLGPGVPAPGASGANSP